MTAPEARAVAVAAVAADRRILPEQVEAVRERQAGDVAVVAYVVPGEHGPVRGFAGVRRREGDPTWRASSGWSSEERPVPEDALWIAWGGWGSGAHAAPTTGVHGGWVNDPAAALVRITDATGRVLEDRVEAGVAIVVWTGALQRRGAVVELLDDGGVVLRRALLDAKA